MSKRPETTQHSSLLDDHDRKDGPMDCDKPSASQQRPSLWLWLDEKLARFKHVTTETYYGAGPLPHEEWKAEYDELLEVPRG